MSDYPGQTPDGQKPEGQQESSGYDPEYTAPITPSGPAPVADPTVAQPAQGQQPSGGAHQPAPYPQGPYHQAPYQQSPYQQGPYQQGPYQQAPYQQGPYAHPAYAAPGYGYGYGFAPQTHPRATTAMVLGLVSLIGSLFLCGLPLLVAPFAWGVGQSALTQIRTSQGRYGGEGQARAGQVMGIIGTVLLVIAIGLVVWFAVELGHHGFSEGSSSGTST